VCQIFPEISGLFKHPKHPYSYGLGWYHIATLGTRQAHGIWDVTVPDTYAESHIDQTAREACSAANKAAANKTVKYGALSASHIFLPVAVETAGTWNQSAIELIQEIGRRITAVTEDTRETVFLFQRLSIALQRGNAVAFLATFDAV